MAEQSSENQHQQTTGEEMEETVLTNNESAGDGYKPEEANINSVHPEASSSECTNSGATNDTNEDNKPTEVKNLTSGETKMPPLTERSPSPENEKRQTLEENSTETQADDRGHGDFGRKQASSEAEKIDAEEHLTAAQRIKTTQGDGEYDKVDGPKEKLNEESLDIAEESTEEKEVERRSCGNNLAEEAKNEEDKEEDGNSTSIHALLQPKSSARQQICQQISDVETLGPTTEEHVGIPRGNNRYVIPVAVLVFAILISYYLSFWEAPPQKNDEQQIDIFLRHMEELMSRFPDQRFELWKRSKIHLLRHLQTAQPTEPVSLILTAGFRGERTLHCLALGMASAFSSALNASVLHIDGASKASQDSDQVKLDIDRNLQGAFEGDKPVAVIHRFEELPPSSTLIFYRYCDHENAAYKKTFLIFTVLLGEEEEIPATSRLSAVEEMVDDHLQKKFLSGDHPVSYDRMDLDKYGGLWSRISHLILPVAAVERIEQKGC